MATQTAPAAAQQDELASQIRVAVPERSLRSDLRAVSIVWRREMIRFRRDRLRAVTSLIQPLLFLLVLGTGLSSLAGHSLPSGVNFKTFIFPGVLAMSVLFTAVFSAASIVWDREFGFLREMLVAPVSRAAIVIGKCLGGATIATFQGIVMLALAGLAGVPYNPVLFAILIGELLLLSFTITAFGVMMAARITQFQAFMALTQMLVMPLFFLSGALYPLSGLPGWLSVLTRIDPLTYVVGPMRHAVFSHLSLNPVVASRLSPSITWLGWPVPVMAVAGPGRGHGPGHAGRGHRRVQQVRVAAAGPRPGTGPARSGVAQPQHQAAGQQRRRRPGGQHAEPGPRADRQAAQAGGGLDGQPGRHRPDLLHMAVPLRAEHLGHHRDQVEQAEDQADGRGRVPDDGGHAQAEQGDQRQVQHRPGRRPGHRPVGQRQRREAAGRGEAVPGQDEPPGQQRAEHAEAPGGQHRGR